MSAPRVIAALFFAIAVALTSAAGTSLAQQMVPPTGAPIELGVNKGTLIRLDHNADTVFVADPEIADVKVKSPKLIYLFAKQPGETSLYAVDAQDHVLFNRPITVTRDVGRIQLALNQMLPNSSVDVEAVNGSLVLVGSVNSPLEAEEAKRIARPFVTDDKEIVNHITIDQPNQVNLRVRVAEVQRNIIKQLGINWDAIGRVGSFAFGLATGTPVTTIPLMTTSPANTSTGNFITRNVGPSGVPTNSYLFGVNTPDVNVNSVIDALDQNGLVNILAEPNLTAMSGETASFLAGGEFPIVVPQNQNQVTVEFKPFGVALAFTPVVLESGRISLRVRPEVSQLSTTGAVQISGFTIPALSTRRAETTVELGSGQSFAIGGLLQNNITDTLNKVPGLGELPVLGALFRSDSFQRNESELVILVTPYLVKPVSDRRLQGPNSGYTPPNDIDRVLRGRNVRATEPVGGTAPTGDLEGNKLIGPAGFSLN